MVAIAEGAERVASSGPTTAQLSAAIDELKGVAALMWDTDLRLVMAAGDSLRRAGYDAAALIGKRADEVLSRRAWTRLGPYYAGTLRGESPGPVDYLSGDSQIEYQMRFRPLLDVDGITVVGGMAIIQEVTEQRAEQNLLEQIQRLGHVGSYTFDRIRGWRADDELLALLGADSVDGIDGAFEQLVVAEDRCAVRQAIDEVVGAGGRATVRYRIVHGDSGDVRHMVGAFMGVLDADGGLLRMITAHVDVTSAVAAAKSRVSASRARAVLLRRVSDKLAASTGPTDEQIRSIIDVAVAVVGDGALVQVFDHTGTAEVDLVSVTAEPHDARITADLIEPLRTPPRAARSRHVTSLWSSEKTPNWRQELAAATGRAVPAALPHVISAPIRHTGRNLGVLRVFRLDPANTFQRDDAELTQMIADRVGAVVGEDRVRQELRRQHRQGELLAAQLERLTAEQRELLDQLSNVEERERALLAEAIHDEPLQMVLAVIMQLDMFAINDSTSQSQRLEPMLATLESAVAQLRTLIIALTPPDLADGLGGALRRLAEGIFVGQPTRIVVTGLAHVSLTPLRKVNAYNILREAMVNVRKHARASTVRVSLEESDGVVTAVVADDGVGSDEMHPGASHLGIATMRARAVAEGGELLVESAAGRGTRVVLTLPITPPDGDRAPHGPRPRPPVSLPIPQQSSAERAGDGR